MSSSLDSTTATVSGSFRDPSGYLFSHEGTLYRQVSRVYQPHYDLLNQSGLYEALVAERLLIPHREVAPPCPLPEDTCKVLQPELVPFISYPYEWCFSQLKDAALLTLRIQELALRRGMTLKDASAYNVQFRDGRPVFIDTLSFERHTEGRPWGAYRQFCQHFLAPLILMATRDVRLGQLFRIHIDGVPLDLASKLLPLRARFSLAGFVHIHMHARFQAASGDKGGQAKQKTVSPMALRGLLDNLASAIRKLDWKPAGTVWADYYNATNYSDEAMRHKAELVSGMLDAIKPESVWDLGANNGQFSRLASRRGISTLALDFDPAAVEQNYRICKKNGERGLLPLVMDLANPSAAIGWNGEERMALFERGPADTVMGLALIHHLAISNNVPLARLAAFFARLCRNLIIEFVPKEDSQVQRLLAGREDVFTDYTREGFERAFGRWFATAAVRPIPGTHRLLYHMVKGGDD